WAPEGAPPLSIPGIRALLDHPPPAAYESVLVEVARLYPDDPEVRRRVLAAVRDGGDGAARIAGVEALAALPDAQPGQVSDDLGIEVGNALKRETYPGAIGALAELVAKARIRNSYTQAALVERLLAEGTDPRLIDHLGALGENLAPELYPLI